MTPIQACIEKLPNILKLSAKALIALDRQFGRTTMLEYARAGDFNTKWMCCLLLNTKVAIDVMKAKAEMTERDAVAEARLDRRLEKALSDTEALLTKVLPWPA
jgi:predicted metal-binding transcription factor (methanogenesis marker protein 9)